MRVYIKDKEHNVPIAFVIPTRLLLSRPCIKAAYKALSRKNKAKNAPAEGEPAVNEVVGQDKTAARFDAGKLARELRRLKRKNGWLVDIEVESADGEIVKLKI